MPVKWCDGRGKEVTAYQDASGKYVAQCPNCYVEFSASPGKNYIPNHREGQNWTGR